MDGPGTGDGFALFCAGEIDIADASRAIKPEGEADVCATNGVEYVELKVALDGLSVITSAADTALECLTFADLYALIGPESTGFANWTQAQALATELGSPTTFPDAPLTVTGSRRGVRHVRLLRRDGHRAHRRGTQPGRGGGVARPDYQSSANDLTIVEGVAGTAGQRHHPGLGRLRVRRGEPATPTIKPLALDRRRRAASRRPTTPSRMARTPSPAPCSST